MLFADIQTFFGQGILMFGIASALLIHFVKKFVSGNDELKSAAKDMATKKAVGFLQRFMR